MDERKGCDFLSYLSYQGFELFGKENTKVGAKRYYAFFAFAITKSGCRGSQGVYPHCLTAIGDSFEKFKRAGDNVKIPNVDGYKELVDALHSVKYLGKVVPMGKEISVRVLKH